MGIKFIQKILLYPNGICYQVVTAFDGPFFGAFKKPASYFVVFRPFPLQSVHIGGKYSRTRIQPRPYCAAGIAKLKDNVKVVFPAVNDTIEIINKLSECTEQKLRIKTMDQPDTFKDILFIRMTVRTIHGYRMSALGHANRKLLCKLFKPSVLIGNPPRSNNGYFHCSLKN